METEKVIQSAKYLLKKAEITEDVAVKDELINKALTYIENRTGVDTPLKIYFNSKSAMSAFAINSGFRYERCRLSCNHVDHKHDGIILIANSVIKAELVKCNTCYAIQLGKEASHE